MSLQEEIRSVLARSTGPMKAGEIREQVGEDDYTSVQIGSALYTMEKAGDIEKHGERGAYRYHLVPGKKAAAKAPVAAPTKEPVAPKEETPCPVQGKARQASQPAAQAQTTVSGPSKAPKIEVRMPAEEAERVIERFTRNTVLLPLHTVRTLVAGILTHGGPDLGAELRRAVIEATEAAA